MTAKIVSHPMLDEKRLTWLIPAMADFECEHGRLPNDESAACGCWPTEKKAA